MNGTGQSTKEIGEMQLEVVLWHLIEKAIATATCCTAQQIISNILIYIARPL